MTGEDLRREISSIYGADVKVLDTCMVRPIISVEYGAEDEVPVGCEGDIILKCDWPPYHKPKPAYYQECLRRAGISPGESLSSAVPKLHLLFSRGLIPSWEFAILIGMLIP